MFEFLFVNLNHRIIPDLSRDFEVYVKTYKNFIWNVKFNLQSKLQTRDDDDLFTMYIKS